MQHRKSAMLEKSPRRSQRTSAFLKVHTAPTQLLPAQVFAVLQGEPKAGRRSLGWLDVGRKRKILVLIKDRRMTVFCLTNYDRLEILSVHRKIREGNQTTAESTALWAEHPNGPQEILVGHSALLPLSSVWLRHSPSHGPFPFSFQ